MKYYTDFLNDCAARMAQALKTNYTITTATYTPTIQAPPMRMPVVVNPYALDPDARHLARIRRELAAPWPPKGPR